jgi:hypothetical protein
MFKTIHFSFCLETLCPAFRFIYPSLPCHYLICISRKRNFWLTKSFPVRPHLLAPETILQAHLSPHLASQQSQLNARLQTTQSQNETLHKEVLAQREELAALLAELDATIADVDGANGLLDEVAGDLAAEARIAEVEMAGT